MIESIEFKNFKALRDTTLPLSQFSLIVGPNGSGKSTALGATQVLANAGNWNFHMLRSAGIADNQSVALSANWREPNNEYTLRCEWTKHQFIGLTIEPGGNNLLQ